MAFFLLLGTNMKFCLQIWGKKESQESKIVALVDRGLEFSQFVLSQFRKTGESQVQSPA